MGFRSDGTSVDELMDVETSRLMQFHVDGWMAVALGVMMMRIRFPVRRVCVSAGLLRVPDSAYKTGPSLGENLTLALLLCTFMALPNLSLEFNSAGTSLLLRYVSGRAILRTFNYSAKLSNQKNSEDLLSAINSRSSDFDTHIFVSSLDETHNEKSYYSH